MLQISPIPAFDDNYLWLLTDSQSTQAYIIDPGDGKKVQQVLDQQGLTLMGILVTHRHWDHVDGINDLLQHHPVPVYGPDAETIPHITHPLHDGEHITLFDQYTFSVIASPGHTAEHISYYCADAFEYPLLFCGDTLFAAGCGRIFSDGSAEKLYHSLNTLAQLPSSTAVYCTHEYTLSNLEFAKAVEPNNSAFSQRQQQEQQKRYNGQATIPTNIALEKQTNPFLRVQQESVKMAVSHHSSKILHNHSEVFTALRLWKDQF